MHLVQERDAALARKREEARQQARVRLRRALASLCSGAEVFVFGSLTQPGKFSLRSDVDLAMSRLPEGMSQYALISLLEERIGRPVDVLLLNETRLRKKILAVAERWIA